MKRSGFNRKYPTIDLRRKAWNVFSKWICDRDRGICVTCGNRNANQAGHFWHGVLDFDEMNINLQCKSCNLFKSGNLAPYSLYLIKKHGIEKFEDLEKRHYLALRGEYRTDEDYRGLIEKYKLSTGQV